MALNLSKETESLVLEIAAKENRTPDEVIGEWAISYSHQLAESLLQASSDIEQDPLLLIAAEALKQGWVFPREDMSENFDEILSGMLANDNVTTDASETDTH